MDSTTRSTQVNPNHLLDTATDYWRRFGWVTFPVDADKTPLACWSKLRSKIKLHDMQFAFAKRRDATGIAVINGQTSDFLVIRDYDTNESYLEWAATRPDLASILPTAKTGRGFHVYFRSTSKFVALKDGEYRGTSNQYTLTPPSYHGACQNYYHWIVSPQKNIPTITDPVASGLLKETFKISAGGTLRGKRDIQGVCVGGEDREDSSSIFSLYPGVERLIRLHQPTGVGERHQRLFDLARAIKGADGVVWTTARLETVFDCWWRQAVKTVGTKDRQLNWHQFQDAFNRVRCPVSLGWEMILSLANSLPIHPCLVELPEPEKRLGQVCSCLQTLTGAEEFFLSKELAGKVNNQSGSAGFRLLRKLQRRGLLQMTQRGSNLTGRANYWVFGG